MTPRRNQPPGRFAPARRNQPPGRFAPARRDQPPGRFAPARVLLLIGFLCLALLVYFTMLTQTAVALLRTGTPAAVALGVGVLGLPVIGVWVMAATLRAGLSHQRLARLAQVDGMELDVSGLPRTPSGRIKREAADELFARVRTELEADPDNWQCWYRVARAYDYAGDRGRAREAMRRAVELERR